MLQKTLITGFPRIGEKRELKKALESYWSGKSSIENLQTVAKALRKKYWQYQSESGIDFISSNDFSLYDNMLDTIMMLSAIPERFTKIKNKTEQYFAMARGSEDALAMEMTKWFNTNYHYIVPELNDSIKFSLDASKIISEYNEAKSLGIKTKINVIGPLTFLGLAKTESGKSPYSYFEDVLSVYKNLLQEISNLDDTVYVQIDEPIFVKEPNSEQLQLLEETYNTLGIVSENIKIIVTTYFEHSNEATKVLVDTPIWGLGLDFVSGPRNIEIIDSVKDKKIIAGVINGRNIWANNLKESLDFLNNLIQKLSSDQIIISTSCSLLHTPYSLVFEPDNELKKRMAFACEKVGEIALLSRLFSFSSVCDRDKVALDILDETNKSKIRTNNTVQDRLNSLSKIERSETALERLPIQHKSLALSELPTTTIGSFPQTKEIRRLRRQFKKNEIALEVYEEQIKKYIDECIEFQEEIGLDVLVHGEPERNDMVEYFGEMLAGFHFTDFGWVQSYGSRCVKPPIIYGDVSRPEAMTVKWITYAQSKTDKIMKGMLTGPVTILNWSFVRDDIPRSEVAKQIALALSDEIDDLQSEGIKIIQVDEAAFKEGYPLRKENITEYENWAVSSFKLAVSKAKKETQIHTHMCYSEFNDIIKTIEAMDADVITIETSRSGNKLLNVFKDVGYKNEIGPGVYDIHSPRVPSVEEFEDQIKSIMELLPLEKIWINPDCGLKTRKWEEVKPALKNMVEAVNNIR